MDLNEIRQQIDTVDNEIVALLEERMKLVTRVSAYKQRTGKAIYDPEREQALLDKVVIVSLILNIKKLSLLVLRIL